MRTLIVAMLSASLAFALPAGAADTTLDRIKQSGVLKLGYRENSTPFSFVTEDKKPRGYSIDLCQAVAGDLAKQLNMPNLDVSWIPVTAKSRFDALKSGEIDLECGNTTQTLSRRADFDFSLMTFVDGASMLFLKGEAPTSQDQLKTQRIVVVSGTTTEKAVNGLVEAQKLSQVIKVSDHDSALKALLDKTATGYAADRTMLMMTALTKSVGQQFEILGSQFTFEPYGLMMRRDHDFRLAVDRSLVRLYRTGEIGPIFKHWFDMLGDPGDVLKLMFLLNGLPE